MNKVITVNLNGNAYQVEESGYNALDEYLADAEAKLKDNPDLVEQDLQQLLPKSQWTAVSQRLLLHGRYVCLARKPQCHTCPVYRHCPWKEKCPQ